MKMQIGTMYRKTKENEKIEVAFLYQAGTVWPSWESVYEACVEDERLSVRLILISDTTVEVSHSVGAEDYLIRKHIEFEKLDTVDFDTYRPHVVFVQFPHDAAFHTPEMLSLQFVRRGIRVVYIPYGMEISDNEIARKDHFNNRVVENAWRVYTSCDGLHQEYKKYCRNRQAVRVCGSPRFDSIVHRDRFLLDEGLKKRIGNRKVVLWKMHFPKKVKEAGSICMLTPSLQEYMDFAEKLSSYNDLFFIVLPHPKMVGKMVASDIQGDGELVNYSRRLIATVKDKDNTYVDTDTDYRNSLFNADAIIIDRSAIMVEAAMSDVPVLFMRNAEYEEPFTVPVRELINTCEMGETCADMCGFLDRLMNGKPYTRDKRELVISELFPFMDGNCGKRIAEDIIQSIKEESTKREELKVVLYGTGEIASYYMREQHWDNPEGFQIVGIVDSDACKHGSVFYGYKVASPEIVIDLDFDYIIVMTDTHFYDIQKKLVYDLFIDDHKVLRLDEFVLLLD